MKGQTLMLITDISGYTRFLTRVGHDEGLKRAQEMLQIVINANTLGLKLCEIEGDAVFFYSMHKLPTGKALMRQISSTSKAFNHYLVHHNLTTELGIKFFVHTGVCEELRIGGRTKLYGTEVIKIHRLLKSITERNDSLLITQKARELLLLDAGQGAQGGTEFPYIGKVRYTVYSENTLLDSPEEPTFYQSLVTNLREAAITITTEMGRVYRQHTSLLYPLQELTTGKHGS